MAPRPVVTAHAGPDGIVVSVGVAEMEDGPTAPCPFHGLVGNARFGVLMGGPCGNACALEMGHVPCRMEMAGHVPHWDACGAWNTVPESGAVAAVMAGFRAYPDCERPEGTSWEGMAVPEWFRLVMGRPWRDGGGAGLAGDPELRQPPA